MIRRATLLASATALFAIAAGVLPATASQGASVTLKVNEYTKSFDVPKRKLTIKSGTAKFTVVVPKSAKHRHGVGIDGGPYNDIEGASVRPGRSTSLTVDLDPGKYTVYDSYRNNRSHGYYVKVTVKD